ncbi:DoxX family protein [Actinomadura graeca]|uniref:DoxX family protein n=1 Tax=Actinomadura graeca TaxID=2750812 RepID=A0ABX8QTY8_9ACTN|nr:DoxX family protein [Actinomadura graeca]QXJ21836.1 DoxX family protein [Actinomadura graeca]
MFTATVILSVLLAVSFVGTGAMKLLGQPKLLEQLGTMGVERNLAAVIGALELAATAGLVIGLWVWWIGAAAAAGLVLLMAGAIRYHARAGHYQDPKLRAPALMPAFLLVLAAVTAVLRTLTA